MASPVEQHIYYLCMHTNPGARPSLAWIIEKLSEELEKVTTARAQTLALAPAPSRSAAMAEAAQADPSAAAPTRPHTRQQVRTPDA